MHFRDWFVWLFRRFYTDKYVAQRYLLAAALTNDGMTYFTVVGGLSIDIDQRLARWSRWEKEYAKRGYALIDCDLDESPITVNGKGRLTHPDILIKIKEGEEIFFAADKIIKMLRGVKDAYGKITPATVRKYLETYEGEENNG